MPGEMVDGVLRRGLMDKSAKVRWKAADWIDVMGRRELIPELTAAVARETNARSRRSMEFDLRLVRDGYILTPAGADGCQSITVRVESGTSGRYISPAEMAAKGVDRIVAEIQAEGRERARDLRENAKGTSRISGVR